MQLSLLDIVAIILYLMGVAWLGIWSRKSQKTTRDYFLGSKVIPWWAMLLSIVATETSALTFIGVPAIAYRSDLTFLQLSFGYIIARTIISFTLLIKYYSLDVTTAYGYLTHRFGPEVKNLTSLIFLIVQTLGIGVRVYAGALVVTVITGWPLVLCIAILCGVTIFYTILGGMKAVIWADVMQASVLFMGGIISATMLIYKIPFSFHEFLSMPEISQKLSILNFSFSHSIPYTFWAGVIGGTFFGMASHGTDQLMVQRLLTCNTLKQSQRALIISGFFISLQFFLFLMVGVLLFCFYHLLPHSGETLPTNPDQIFPYFITHELPRGLSGLVIAGVLSGAMSTLSGALNAFSATTITEFYIPYINKNQSPERLLFLSRWVTGLWGIGIIGIAYMARNWGSVLEAGLTIASFFYGGMLGVFLLGLFFPRIVTRDALVGIVAGVLIVVLVAAYTTVAWPWYALIGSSITIVTAMSSSYVLQKPVEI